VSKRVRDPASAEAALQLFGAELRHWRRARGMSQAEAGRVSAMSREQITKLEAAQRWPTEGFARVMDTVLGTDGALLAIWSRLHAAEAGADDSPDADSGLVWASASRVVQTATDLWRADVARHAVVRDAGWVGSAAIAPVDRWFDEAGTAVLAHSGPRHVGANDVAIMTDMAQVFADADHRLGGGLVRDTLVTYLHQVVDPTLRGSYDDQSGRALFSAAARLCDLAGFMSFDTARQGLGQRYYVQGLRLAKQAGERVLGAHILSDMSMQAHYLHSPIIAQQLAEAGHRTAVSAGSMSTAARCSALLARAHALAGEVGACAAALNRAERELDRTRSDGEPEWIKFFSAEQLSAESLYAAHDLGNTSEVLRHSKQVLDRPAGMHRRRVLVASTLAGSLLPRPDTTSVEPGCDIDEACQVLADALPAMKGLTSARGLAAVNKVRQRLARYAGRAAVQEFENQYRRQVVMA